MLTLMKIAFLKQNKIMKIKKIIQRYHSSFNQNTFSFIDFLFIVLKAGNVEYGIECCCKLIKFCMELNFFFFFLFNINLFKCLSERIHV